MIGVNSSQAVALLLSGGVDSTVLLGQLLRRSLHVQPIYVRCGLTWEREELLAVVRLLRNLRSPRLRPLVTLDLPLGDLYGDHWSLTGEDVPEADDPEEAVFMPGRNLFLLSKSALWCQQQGIEQLAIGHLSGNPFEDASEGFFRDFERLIVRGEQFRVRIVQPLSDTDKLHALELGRHLPLDLTFSCLAPQNGLHCGRCNKCGERRRAFEHALGHDPTRYAAAEAAALS